MDLSESNKSEGSCFSWSLSPSKPFLLGEIHEAHAFVHWEVIKQNLRPPPNHEVLKTSDWWGNCSLLSLTHDTCHFRLLASFERTKSDKRASIFFGCFDETFHIKMKLLGGEIQIDVSQDVLTPPGQG